MLRLQTAGVKQLFSEADGVDAVDLVDASRIGEASTSSTKSTGPVRPLADSLSRHEPSC